ncbi:MAG: alpha/beta hydrolase family protein [Bryobacteraceae bacterium]
MRSMTFLFVLPLLAAPPAHDIRNTYTPGTNTHFQMPEYKTRTEWEARARTLRRQILVAAGLDPMPERTPLNPMIFGRFERGAYSVEKVLLETMPGYYLAGNLYRPIGKPGKLPGVLSPHGHWTYGRLENQPLGSIPLRCINLARQGYVVFSYDMVGYNDTIQTPHAFSHPREQLWSFGPLGLQLWNSIRAADFIESLPEVDPKRIGMTGASGGGTQTFLMYAVDDRIAYAAPVNMISAIMQGGSGCENAPGLRAGAFNVEIGAMMAPRPLLMISATGDWTRNTPREEHPAIRHIYELFDATAKVETVQFDAPHNYNKDSREAMYRFFGKHALGETDETKFKEHASGVEPLPHLMVLHGRTLPPNALTYEQIFTQWVARSRKQQAAASEADLRERLRLAIGVELPGSVDQAIEGERITLGTGKGDRVPGIWLPGKAGGEAILAVHPEGAVAGRGDASIGKLTAAGKPVLLIDAFQTGSAVEPRNEKGSHFLTFNRSKDANRVQDIVTAVSWLRSTGHRNIRIVGLGKASVWALFAAAISQTTLTADTSWFPGTDDDYIRDFFVPGVQRAGGLDVARRLVH